VPLFANWGWCRYALELFEDLAAAIAPP